MGAKRHRRDFLVQQLIGIVLAALELRDDDRALGLTIFRLVEAVGHTLGFDEKQLVERVAPGRFEVGRLIDPGVAVPEAAETLDQSLHLVPRNVPGALEVHVLDPVRGAGTSRALVARAHSIPAPHRHQRRGVNRTDQNLEAVVEVCLADV